MNKPFECRTRRRRRVAAALACVMTLLIAVGVDGLARPSAGETLAEASTDRRA